MCVSITQRVHGTDENVVRRVETFLFNLFSSSVRGVCTYHARLCFVLWIESEGDYNSSHCPKETKYFWVHQSAIIISSSLLINRVTLICLDENKRMFCRPRFRSIAIQRPRPVKKTPVFGAHGSSSIHIRVSHPPAAALYGTTHRV